MSLHDELTSALNVLRPGAQWVLRGDTLSDLEWIDTEQSVPTQAEVDAQIQKQDVPQSVTPRQARLALLEAGFLDQVEAAVETIGGATKITWEYATVFLRDDPMIATLGALLNLTSAQIDALFIRAAQL